MSALILKPTSGWRQLSDIVWEHDNGTRVHCGGVVRLINGDHLFLDHWNESVLGRLLVRINGGNKKRGLMAWAMNLSQI